MDILKFINKTFGTYNVRGFEIEPTYWQVGAIVLLLFLLVFTLARLRFLYLHWSLGKGSISFLLYGFLLALIVEGFLIISGRTLFTEVVGWKSAPKPIGTALDAGRAKLIDVLGTHDSKDSDISNYEIVAQEFSSLSSTDREKLKALICR